MKKNESRRWAWSRLSLAAPLLAAIIGACGGATQGPQLGSESHFLSRCTGSCDGDLECIGGICTRACLTTSPRCSDLALGAACTNQSVEPGQVAVCDLACNVADECEALGAGYTCSGGFCRRPGGGGIGTGGSGGGGSGGGGSGGGAECSAYLDQVPPPVVHTVTIVNAATQTLYISFEGDCGNDSPFSVEADGQPLDLIGCAKLCSDVMLDSQTFDVACACALLAPLPIAPGETLVRTATQPFASHVLPQECSVGLGPEGAMCISRSIPPMGSVASVKAYLDPACTDAGCPSTTARATGNYFFDDVTVVLEGSAD